uniref:Uncharacterized protein n=1 Tax=Octopus bimaculoides TaxID=37653 RepID=A0A0L8I6Y9_OCTBM
MDKNEDEMIRSLFDFYNYLQRMQYTRADQLTIASQAPITNPALRTNRVTKSNSSVAWENESIPKQIRKAIMRTGERLRSFVSRFTSRSTSITNLEAHSARGFQRETMKVKRA